MIFFYLCNLCNLWTKPSLFAFQLSNSGLTAKPIFRYWAWRLKTAATFSAGSGGAFSDVGKMPTLLEGRREQIRAIRATERGRVFTRPLRLS